MDIISQLPEDVKEKILECLPTLDAARTTLLSTHWKDVWLRQGRLVFDAHFFHCLRNPVGIINHILSHRAVPVKKFTLHIPSGNHLNLKLQQSNLDRWCHFLSRNGVEELTIIIYEKQYKLPSCIVSCQTIKQLKLGGFVIDCQVHAGCIFPGVTSLVFEGVDFKASVNGFVSNLEKMSFSNCVGINKFKISAPKLKTLQLPLLNHKFELRWLSLYLKEIMTLCLYGDLLWFNKDVQTFPTAKNLQVIRLYDLNFGRGNQIILALELLESSPNLCKLEIIATNTLVTSRWEEREAALGLLEKDDLDGCIINQDLKMLRTIKIEFFRGSILEMLFVKALLSKSPALEKIVIGTSTTMASKILMELSTFPRVSPKAQLFLMEWKCRSYNLVYLGQWVGQ